MSERTKRTKKKKRKRRGLSRNNRVPTAHAPLRPCAVFLGPKSCNTTTISTVTATKIPELRKKSHMATPSRLQYRSNFFTTVEISSDDCRKSVLHKSKYEYARLSHAVDFNVIFSGTIMGELIWINYGCGGEK